MNGVLCVVVGILCSAGDGQIIESFEAETFASVSPSGCVATRVQEHASDGTWALKVCFAGKVDDTWPGLTFNPGRSQFTRQDILVVDVFNAGTEPASLSWRIDSVDGRNTFITQTLAPGVSTKAEIWFGAIADVVDINNIKCIYPYISKPRKDYELYFDAFQLESTTARFTRLAYREIGPPMAPTASEQELGCVVFARTPLAHVFANSVPWPGERVVTMEATAAQGDTETLALSFRTLDSADSVSLSVTPLTSSSGVLPESCVEIGCVRFLDKKTTYSAKDYVAGVPTYIEPRAEFQKLAGETSRTFWLRIRIPNEASAGIYRAEAILRVRRADGERERRVPIGVRVLPFALPPISTHFIGEYYRLAGKLSPEEEQAAIERDLADMRDHGMTSLGLCYGMDESKVTMNGTEVTSLGFDSATRFERTIEAYVRQGFTMPIILLSDTGQYVAQKAGATGSPDYDAAYKSFWTTAQRTFRERNWPEIIVQPVDEPSWQGKPEQDLNVHLLTLLKQIPGLRTEQDGPPDAYFKDVAGPVSDVWNYNGALAAFPRDMSPPVQRIFTIYNNDVESYRPEVDRYVTGFFQKAAGISGVFNWEYRGGAGSLYDDLDGSSGDFVCNYPPCPDSDGGPSVAWEAAREGADDLRHVILLEQWIAKAQAAPGEEKPEAEATQRLSRLLASIQAKPAVRSSEAWTARWTQAEAEAQGDIPDKDAKGFVGGFLKLPNAWSFADYPRARWAVASETLRLMQSCGENVAAADLFTPAGEARITVLDCVPWSGVKTSAQEANGDKSSELRIDGGDALTLQDDTLNFDVAWANRPAGGGHKLRVRALRENLVLAESVAPVPNAAQWRLCLQIGAMPAGTILIEIQALAEDGTAASNTATHSMIVIHGLPLPNV